MLICPLGIVLSKYHLDLENNVDLQYLFLNQLNFLFLLYRDGVEWFFVKLHEKHVPLLIISGGLGGMMKVENILELYITKQGCH